MKPKLKKGLFIYLTEHAKIIGKFGQGISITNGFNSQEDRHTEYRPDGDFSYSSISVAVLAVSVFICSTRAFTLSNRDRVVK